MSSPTQIPFDENGQPNQAWIQWAKEVDRQSKYKGSDTTANRPVNGVNTGDYYLDTTIGKPIWYLAGGWVDATGASV